MSFIINPYITFPPYDSERSILLDGVNEYVDCGTDSSIDFERTDTFSFSTWVYVNNTGSVYHLIAKRRTSPNLGYNFGILSGGEVYIELVAVSNGGSYLSKRTNSTLSTSQWYHLCMTYDGSSDESGVNFYIDGSSAATTVLKNTLSASIKDTTSLRIGSMTSALYFDGYIDEVSIWDKELSSGEVSEIYNSGCPDNLNNHSASGNLVSWWAIDSNDDATGGTGSIADKTENASMLLDGVNEHINVGTDSSLKQNRSQAQSYSAWININSTSQEYIFGGRQSGDAINTLAWFVFNGNLSFWMRGNGGSGDQFRVNSTTSLSTSTWYHVVSTYDGTSNASGVTHYINGSADTDTDEFDNLTNDIDYTGFNFYVGDLNGSISFNGYLDEVSVWDKELSAAEVTELYNKGRYNTDYTNLSFYGNGVSWWKIDTNDDATGGTGSIADKIGSNTGTPTNTESGDLINNNGTPTNTESGDLNTTIPC